MAGLGDTGTWAAGAAPVAVVGPWSISSVSSAGATAANSTTGQRRQYGRNVDKVKIIILKSVLLLSRDSFFPIVGDHPWLDAPPAAPPPAPHRLTWLANPALTRASSSLRIVRAGVPTGMLAVAKLVVTAAEHAESAPTIRVLLEERLMRTAGSRDASMRADGNHTG